MSRVWQKGHYSVWDEDEIDDWNSKHPNSHSREWERNEQQSQYGGGLLDDVIDNIWDSILGRNKE